MTFFDFAWRMLVMGSAFLIAGVALLWIWLS